MKLEKKQVNDTDVELSIALEQDEIRPHLEHAAKHLSEHRPVAGFRPGKAPFDVVKKHFGEEVVLKEALDGIINASVNKAIAQEGLNVFSESDFVMEKAGIESVSFRITLSLVPNVSIGDWTGKKVKKQEVSVTDKEVEKAVEDLLQMMASEKEALREVRAGDRAVIDFDVFVNGMLLDKGSAKNFPLILGEKKMIPGFEEQIIGKKAGEELSFKLVFPKDYHPSLSGTEAEFKVRINKIFERTIPELTDDLAGRMGEESKDAVLERIRQNIRQEKGYHEKQRMESEALRQVVSSSKIGPIPKKAIDQEADIMLHEFQHDLERQGVSLDSYLQQSGKSKDKIKEELFPRAEERVKTLLVIGKLVEENKFTVTDEEAEKELAEQKKAHANNPRAIEDLQNPSYPRYLKTQMLNRKVVKFILEKIG
jgi:trigger factor